jgi:chemotaxis protein histidine kinase CheA
MAPGGILLVEIKGGTVLVETEAGQGPKFTMRLPAIVNEAG